MHSIEKIEELSKQQFQVTAIKWLLGFGIGFPILLTMLMFLLSVMMDNNFKIEDLLSLLGSIYLSPLYLICMIISTPLVAYSSSKAVKKKMMEENEQEEREKRDEHYRKMEELLEKMSEEKKQNDA